MAFAIHLHELAIGYMCPPHPETPSHLPPHLIPPPYACEDQLALVLHLTYGNKRVSMLFSQSIPPFPSPTESKSMFFTSVSPLLYVGWQVPPF